MTDALDVKTPTVPASCTTLVARYVALTIHGSARLMGCS